MIRYTVLFVRPLRAIPRTAVVALSIALLAGVHPRTIHAQASASAPLLLADLYQSARRDNPRAAAARALARAAEARVPGAGRPPDPQLQLGFMNYTLPGLRPMDPLGMAQLQLMQMVPVAGKLRLTSRTADSRAAAEERRAAETEWEIRRQTAAAFYEVYRLEQSLIVQRETIRLLRDTREITEAMYRVGEGRQADVLRAQVEIARMAEDTTRMSSMRTAALARLGALLNRPIEPSSGPAIPPVFPTALPSLDSMIAIGDSARPMVNAGRREVEAAAAQTELARRELWPDLALGVQLGQRAAADGMGTERMGSLMLGASIPIFARSRQLRMRDEAAAMRQMAEADLASMRADTRASIAEAHADLTRARNLAALYRTTIIPQADATVASSLAAYRAGSVDFMTLLDNRMSLNAWRVELAVLEADEGRAWAELEMLTARQLFDPRIAQQLGESTSTYRGPLP